MPKFGFDQEALIGQFAEASARQGETLRKAVQEATLKALQGRELTLRTFRPPSSRSARRCPRARSRTP